MIRYVKDKNNLASFNQWSGGDYSHNTNGLLIYPSQPIIAEVNTNYSINGESCFEVISEGKLWGYIDIIFTEFTIGKILQVSVDILPLESSCALNIYAVGPNQEVTSTVNIPQNNTFSTYSISSTAIPDETTEIRIRVLQNTADHLHG